MDTPSEAVRQQILQHFGTIPLFARLGECEIQKIYDICTFHRFAADETMYRFGEPSTNLFILLEGRLVARSKFGADIAYISPIGIVGEMGLLTDQPRSADVIVLENAIGLQIDKQNLAGLFRTDARICSRVLINMLKILSAKLCDTNAEIEKLRAEAAQSGSPRSGTDNIFLY